MHREEFLSFERVFGLNRKKYKTESIFDHTEWSTAKLVYRVACDEICIDENDSDNECDDDLAYGCNDVGNDLVQSFDEQIEAVMDSFKRVVELFAILSKAKNVFLEKFCSCLSFRRKNIERLKEMAEEIQAYKYNSGIAQIAGGALGVVGGVMTLASLFTPLAAVTLPLSISGIGGYVVSSARGAESVLMKRKLEEAKTLVMEDKLNFSETVDLWFIHTKELKVAIESLVSYSLLKAMYRDLKGFHEMNAANQSKRVLKLCIRKMLKFSNMIESFGAVYAPVVMTFVIVVCLLKHHNWIVLDCAMQTDSLEKSRKPFMAIEGEVELNCALSATTEIIINILTMVRTSIDMNKPSEDAKKLRKAAELFEDELLFVKRVYNELKKWEPINRSDAESLNWSDMEH